MLGQRMNNGNQWRSCVALLSLLAVVSSRLEGEIVTLRKFNDEVEAVHIPFPVGHPQTTHKQTLEGDLAVFSPHCSRCTPDGFTHVHLPQGGGHAILSGKALSLLHSNGTVLQAIPLNNSCDPLYLQFSFIDQTVPFIVVCSASCYQGATWNGKTISLGVPTDCGQAGGVFVEGQHELFLVTYSDGWVYEYSFSSGTFYSPPLPDVHCEGAGDLYPLHRQEAYLLQCNTADGPALYIISLHGSGVRAISAAGRPQAAPDGEHFIVINGSFLRLYVTANQTVTPKAKTFSSDITHAEFLTSRHLSLVTEGGEHVLVDIEQIFDVSAAGEAIVKLVGGQPLVMLWIDPEAYVYVARDTNSALQLYFYNVSSGKEWEGGREMADTPDLLVFTEKSVDTPPGGAVNGGTDVGLSSGEIAVIIVIAVIAVIAVSGGLLLVIVLAKPDFRKFPLRRKRQRLLNSNATTTPVSSTPEPEILQETKEEDVECGSSTAFLLPNQEIEPPTPAEEPQPVSTEDRQPVPAPESQTDGETVKKEDDAGPSSNLPGSANTSNSELFLNKRGTERMEEAVEETQQDPHEETSPYSNFNELKSVQAHERSNTLSFSEGHAENYYNQDGDRLVHGQWPATP